MSEKKATGNVVLTVGYGGDTVSGLIERLRSARVTHVIDVRSRPYSQARPEFNAPELDHCLQTLGVGYLFLGEQLGGRPDDPACYTPEGLVDYQKIRESESFAVGLERVRRGAQKGYRLCLLCSEGKPEACHRTKLVAEALVESHGIEVVHIDRDGSEVDHGTVMNRLRAGQQVFGFADTTTHSAGRYEVDGSRL